MTLRQVKVLIADASNTVHQLIRDSLPGDYSTNVLQAFDGVDCLDALDQGVDLAFIDVHMPTMDGMDALWAARIAGNKTFVTLISGQANRRCIDLARQLEAYEFLTKPFGKADIEAILATHRRVTTPMQVLLVDDSPVSLKVMRKVLDNSVFRLNISDVNTGAEALAQCDTESFDVVFLDVNMPGLDGHAALARLVQANSRTKVVMISSERDGPARATSTQSGCCGHHAQAFLSHGDRCCPASNHGPAIAEACDRRLCPRFRHQDPRPHHYRRARRLRSHIRIRLVPRAAESALAVGPGE